ncbi:MAG: flavodoxin [Clostridiales Family XIII bacterium]|jgi:flavodoxin short chain|nr:flavodoxin [Clostridiales Family XIII bacterium]
MKINIIYWSGTGNTEAMAGLIREGAESGGAEVAAKTVSGATDADLDCDVLALGCPSMGAEELEETEFDPWFSSVEGKLAGRKLALFGSYGWGDGEWMRNWVQRARDAGADVLGDGLIVNEAPAGEEAGRCKAFGAGLAG